MMKKTQNANSHANVQNYNYPSLFNNNSRQRNKNACLVKYLNPSRSNLQKLGNASHVRSCSSISDLQVNGHSTSTAQKQNQNRMFFVSSTSALQTMNDLNQTNYLNSIKKFANKHKPKTNESTVNNQQVKSNKLKQNKSIDRDHSPNRPNSLNSKIKNIINKQVRPSAKNNGNFCFSLKHLINHKQDQRNLQNVSYKNQQSKNFDSFQNQSFQNPYEDDEVYIQKSEDKRLMTKNNKTQIPVQKLKSNHKKEGQGSGKQNYDLMLKLKNYIEQLKRNQNSHLEEIQNLRIQNADLKHKSNFLNDKIKVLQARDCQLNRLNKKHDKEKKMLKTDNQLIVQSLKKVINQQMEKIIELQRRQLQRQNLSKRESVCSEDQQFGDLQSDSQYSKFKLQKDSCSGRQQAELSEDSHKQNQKQRSIIRTQVTQQADQYYQKNTDNLLEEVDNYLTRWLGTSKV